MSVASKERLLKKLGNREYRNAYAEESVKTTLPFQIRAIREQRDWSQDILGREMGMRQNAVSRLENPDYGNLSVNTLLRAANAFDCGLLIKFVPFSRLLLEFEDLSPDALGADKFEDDADALEKWADVEILASSVLTSSTEGVRDSTRISDPLDTYMPSLSAPLEASTHYGSFYFRAAKMIGI